MNDKKTCLKRLQTYDFVLYELGLYLDTHPDCQEAMAQYTLYNAKRREAVDDYVSRFGPLEMTDFCGKCWNWKNGPWPWEKEAN